MGTKTESRDRDFPLLRNRAEKILAEKANRSSGDWPKEVRELIHELDVHRIELEMQNDELRQAQAVIEESRSQLSDLYDFAPVPYITLSFKGLILQANLKAADLFEAGRSSLLQRRFSSYIVPADHDPFRRHRLETIREPGKHSCELRLLKKSGSTVDVVIESTGAGDKDKEGKFTQIRSVLRDVTAHKHLEDELRESHARLRTLSSQLLNIQESERKRIALEVHDSLGQSLNAIKFKIQDTITRVEKENETAAERLRELLPVIQEGIEEARRIQMDLRPSILDDLGIDATISWFCRQFRSTYGSIEVKTQVKIQENRLPAALKTVIFRTVQEAMNNVAKHSAASHVALSLVNRGNEVQLTVEDNGQGFDLDQTLSEEGREKGLGLTSMRERAELSGGTFSIQSTKGKGTTVRLSWPLQED